MKNKQLYFYILVFLLAGANVWLLTRISARDKFISETLPRLSAQYDLRSSLQYDLSELSKYDTLQFGSEDRMVSSDLQLRDLGGNLTTLGSLISSGPKLVFRYSELNCNVCYQKVLDELSGLIKKIGPENILIITSYSNQRELYNFMRINNITKNVFNIGSATLGLPVDDYDVPYLFVLDRSLKTKLLFIPFKQNPVMTKKYFLFVKDKFQS